LVDGIGCGFFACSELFVVGIINDSQLLAFTGCGSSLASRQVDTTFRCFGRPSTILLLTREDGKHSAASLIEALSVQLTLVGVLGQLFDCNCNVQMVPKNIVIGRTKKVPLYIVLTLPDVD